MLGIRVPDDINMWRGKRVILRGGYIRVPEDEENLPPEAWSRVHPNYLNLGLHVLLLAVVASILAWVIYLNTSWHQSVDAKWLHYGTQISILSGLTFLIARTVLNFLASGNFTKKLAKANLPAVACYRMHIQGWAPFVTLFLFLMMFIALVLVSAANAGETFEVLALTTVAGGVLGFTLVYPVLLFQNRKKRWQELMSVPETPEPESE